ncbi:MAG: hypothetical protein Q9195_005944 [Heterodermia aff. obscurata]
MNDIPLEDQHARRIETRIGARGPFDEVKTSEEVLGRVNDFLLRTGLHDYTQYFKIGAFLARRRFGKQQAEFLRQEHREEDRACRDEERRRGEANATLEGARLGRPNINVGPTAMDDNLQLRRKYDIDQLMKEGHRGRWTIYSYEWRFMVGSPMVVPIVLFFLMMALPESPRWHILKARRLQRQEQQKNRLKIERHYEAAFQALRQLRNSKVQAARDLFHIDAWIIMIDDQRTAASSSTNGEIWHRYSLGFGAINFGIAVMATFLIDRVGRRLLLLTTFPLMSVLQFTIGLSLQLASIGRRQALVATFAYLFCVAYSIGEGPVPLVYASECLPLEVRDTGKISITCPSQRGVSQLPQRPRFANPLAGVGVLTGVYWGLNSLMALTWPKMYETFDALGAFGFYALLNLIGWFLLICYVPETSRYTLEELDNVFSFNMHDIRHNGVAQMLWLVTFGWAHGRPYPELVPREADNRSHAD